MKKKIISLVVVLVLLAGSVAAYFLLTGEELPAEDEEAIEETYVLGGIPKPFVVRFEVRNQLDTFVVVNGFENAIHEENAPEGNYLIEGMEQDYLNMTLLKSTMNNAAALTAKQEVDVGGADLSTYGLKEPRATVDITYDEGSARLLIGDDAPGSEGTYVMVDEKVYLVASNKLTNFLGSRFDFVNKLVTNTGTEMTTFTDAVLSGPNMEQPVVIRKLGEGETMEAGGMMLQSHHITEPIQIGFDSQTGGDAILSVFGLAADEVAADTSTDPEAIEAYGLTQPYGTIEVASDDEAVGAVSLEISAPDETGSVYVLSGDSPFIYRMSKDAFPWLEMSLFDLQEKVAVLPFIDDVSGVDVQVGDEVYSFTLEGADDDMTVSVNGTELDLKNFRQFYQTLISARFDSEVEQQPASGEAESSESAESEESSEPAESEAEPTEPTESEAESAEPAESEAEAFTEQPGEETTSGEIILQYTYYYKDGRQPDVVTFSPGPARKYYISLNGGKVYYVRSLYVDRVLEDLPKVVAGETVKSYI